MCVLLTAIACGDDTESDVGVPDMGLDMEVSEPCGAVTCDAGLVCCNSSCGTCVLPGESCVTLACTDAGMDADVPNADSDDDGVLDVRDNCVMVPNPEQRDFDGDRSGDLCDRDADGDGVEDTFSGEDFLKRAQVMDFFLQDVCLDERFEIVPEDPKTCVAAGRAIRNIQPDDRVPYVMMKQGSDPFDGESMFSSRQVRLLEGGVGAITLQDERGGAYFQADRIRVPFPFQRILRRDRVNVYELNGESASRMAAEGSFGNITYFSADCDNDDASIMVDMTRLKMGETQSVVHGSKGTLGSNCPMDPSSNTEPTETRLELFEYDQGESLLSLKVVENTSTGATISYFTREYGLVRTEQWSDSEDALPGGSCLGSAAQNGMVRTNCQERMRFLALDDAWDTRSASIEIAEANLIVYGDLGYTRNPFQIFEDGNVTMGFEREPDEPTPRGNNTFLSATWNGIGASSVFADVVVSEGMSGDEFAFGGTLLSEAGVEVELNQLQGGALLESESAVYSPGTRQTVESTFVLNPDTEVVRLEFKIQDAGLAVAIDDVFVVPVAD